MDFIPLENELQQCFVFKYDLSNFSIESKFKIMYLFLCFTLI